MRMYPSHRRSSVDFNSSPARSLRRQSVDSLTVGDGARRQIPLMLNLKNRHKSYISECKTPSVKDFPSPGGFSLEDAECTTDYLAKLIREKKQLECFPKYFENVEILLAKEIARVRSALFSTDFVTEELELPEPEGEVTTITEKVYVPVHEYPEFNFVGRILGPRGMTSKQLEQETGCKIMVRGRGSMKDKRKEEANRGRPNWEHLDEDLHVLIQCEDTENRCRVKLDAATKQIRRLLVPAPEGTDDLKRKQLMELAIMNGTYRPNSTGGRSPNGRDAENSASPTRFPFNSTFSPESPRTSSSLSPRSRVQSTNSDVFVNNNNNMDYSTLSSILNCPGLLESLGALQLNDSIIPGIHPNPFDSSSFSHFGLDAFSQSRVEDHHHSHGSNSNASFGLE